jgi:hypothetical protein
MLSFFSGRVQAAVQEKPIFSGLVLGEMNVDTDSEQMASKTWGGLSDKRETV